MTASTYKVIGSRPLRPDGVDKVTGRALYGADVKLPGMLHGKVLRSPHAHARILSIDFSAARALPGVRAVVTAQDLPSIGDQMADLGESTVNLRYVSNNILAHDKVLYYGHAVAAVAADNVHVAEEALALIKVEYERLPHVLDGKQAMLPEAPILLSDLRTNELGKLGDAPTNVASHLCHQRGDLAAGFAQADVVVERTFQTAMVHQGYIEPQTVTALWNEDDQLSIWCSTQGAFSVQEQLAELLQIPLSRITVTPTEIGGGFGGKINVYLDPVAALLSRKAGHRPVKMTMTRAEVLAGTGPTSGSHIRVKMGARRDGTLTAAEAELIYEAGAYPGSPVGAGCSVIFGPYRLENLQIDGYDVVVNRPKTAAYRAPGGTNAIFASETVIDELAEAVGLDPVEFRLRNAVREGDSRPDGPEYRRIGLMETLEAARTHPHYQTRLTGKHRGRGFAVSAWFNWGGKSSATATVNKDGTVNLIEGSTDIGGSRASIAMQLAETLGVAYDDIRPQVVGTAGVGYNDVTGGSRTTFGTGWAVYEVGKALLAEMGRRAADYWDVPAESVHAENGVFAHNGDRLTFRELAGKLDVPVTASAAVHPQGYGPGFGAHIVDVEVDVETGKVTILRYTAVQDVGKAIHPSYVEGQLQGGVAQGVGWALNEEYIYDAQGRLVNASLLDYRMPTALDLPMIDTVLVEVPNPGHPYGVRGVGEVPIMPPAAAVANAIYQAVGVRMAELPMSPARMAAALAAQG
ncbi:MAG: xanthine dehydrogenase family protein molybdopterin-binding subunit [Caldilinea sp.]|jgi:CO/xanthine dehydrogenase Mo-binding subunit|nr:xanthine dehydrogenase family protein molybdopterin-binding subunit [Caldilinea sp.]